MRTHHHRGDDRQKIIALWTAFLLGMLFHTQLALMPLFHGLSVAHSHINDLPLTTLFWLMLGVFGMAMAAIIATAFVKGQRYKTLHFGLTLLYTVINISHLTLDLIVGVPSYQLCLMGYLLLIGLLLNLVAFQWFHSELDKQPVLRSAR